MLLTVTLRVVASGSSSHDLGVLTLGVRVPLLLLLTSNFLKAVDVALKVGLAVYNGVGRGSVHLLSRVQSG